MTNFYILPVLVWEVAEGSADLILNDEVYVGVCPEGKYFNQQLCLDCPSGHL